MPHRFIACSVVSCFLVACAGGDSTPAGGGGTGGDGASSTTTSTGAGGGGGAGQGGQQAGGGGGGQGGDTGGGGSGQGGGGGGDCTWSANANPCGAGMFCDAPGCGAGTCEPVGPVANETPDEVPVCGCDGATYWNASVALSHGMAVQGSGECANSPICGGFGGIQCDAGLSCNYGGKSIQICNIADGTGVCWGLPATCPQIVIGPQTHACNGACQEKCALIKQGIAFYDDPTCPQ